MVRAKTRRGRDFFNWGAKPRASKDEIAGEMGGALRYGSELQPWKTVQNEALVEFLAELFETSGRLLVF